MAWSITNKADTSSFTKMAEIRAHLRNSAENKDKNDDIFPEDVIIPSTKPKTKRATTPRKPAATKRSTKKDKEKEEVEEEVVIEEYHQTTEENSPPPSSSPGVGDIVESVTAVELDDSNGDNDNDDNEPMVQVEAGKVNHSARSDLSDLKVATDNIVKDLKKIITRISAVSTVLEDVQAAGISRQFTSMTKSITTLSDLVTEGKSKVVRKKVKTCKK
ncbi:VLTF-4 viral late transcription factor [Variola virus]|uniref:VLTF-4 viral late transcription factor n=1 Tax=Variola virus TaxID=10255 RepID=Q0N822_VARV|nr:VLTF-4 viral late transcription factor [Variola virus]ABF28275.1 VLTF-4 viral late transcription factor [Variola virus]ABG43865.1 VLTF-4 viral late transcription factor [Variola virus]UXO31075.1 VLTF-4 viral late transcription factor [Variola virus]